MTSRGCPYSCTFCYLTVFKDRKYRTIPHDTILEDLDSVRNNSVVIVTDENFIGYSEEDREDRKILLEKMIRKGYKFFWGCQSTTTLATQPELMDLMHRAGCRAVFVGFESFEQEGLKQVRKSHNVGLNYSEIIAKLHEHKIAVIASTILGLDSHTKSYPDQLIKGMKKARWISPGCSSPPPGREHPCSRAWKRKGGSAATGTKSEKTSLPSTSSTSPGKKRSRPGRRSWTPFSTSSRDAGHLPMDLQGEDSFLHVSENEHQEPDS